MHRSTIPIIAFVLTLGLAGVTSHASAQGLQADTSLAAAVASVRTGSGGVARALLAQSRGPETPQKLQAIADSLVAIALIPERTSSTDEVRAARTALAVLGSAGSGGTPPFQGALPALARIFAGSRDPGIQAGSLRMMAQLPDQGLVLPLLLDTAASQNRVAYVAVLLLADELGPAGLTALRRLHEDEAVTEPNAARALYFIARREGWPDSP